MEAAQQLTKLSFEQLNWKSDAKSWSILECIEHLNRYSDFYIPEITQKIKTAKHKASPEFKSNWLGKYFSKSVAYSEDLNKMKTFKSMNPLNSELSISTLDKFINQQLEVMELLNQSKAINLDKTKAPAFPSLHRGYTKRSGFRGTNVPAPQSLSGLRSCILRQQ